MLKGLFKKKSVIRDLNTAERVQQAQSIVKSSMSVFKEIYDQVDEANNILRETIVQDKVKISQLENNVELATSEFQANVALQNKLGEFIK